MPKGRHLQTSAALDKVEAKNIFRKRAFIWSCVGLNTFVFLCWQVPKSKPDYTWIRRALWEDWTLSSRNFMQGRWWTAITSAFSHADPFHLLFNMITFISIAPILTYTRGLKARHLSTLILGSAVGGSTAFLAHDRTNFARPDTITGRIGGMLGAQRQQRVERYGLGFSGALSGLLTSAALLHPHQRLLLMGVVPLPLWAVAGGYMVYDTYRLDDAHSSVGHDAHLGGAIFGALWYMVSLRKFGGVLGPKHLR